MAPRNQGLDASGHLMIPATLTTTRLLKARATRNRDNGTLVPTGHMLTSVTAENTAGGTHIKPSVPDHAGRQYSDSPYLPNDLQVKFDRWNNVIADNMSHHDAGEVGDSGQFGSRHYAEFQKSDQDGYGVVIQHSENPTWNQPSVVYVDNSRADHGKDQ